MTEVTPSLPLYAITEWTGITLPSSPFTSFSIMSIYENYVSETDIHRNKGLWWRLTTYIPYTC